MEIEKKAASRWHDDEDISRKSKKKKSKEEIPEPLPLVQPSPMEFEKADIVETGSPPSTPTGQGTDTPPGTPQSPKDQFIKPEGTAPTAAEEVIAIPSPARPTSPLPEPFSSRPPWLLGCRDVDNYARLNVIQEGTYGVVYRAQDKETKEVVALKKFKLEKEKEGFPITALREIVILLRMKHPNIVNLKEVVMRSNSNKIYLVMEFLEHDLRDLMDEMKTHFVTSEVKCLLQQLLRGVAHLHENWIIHRDLKTSNLLMNNKGVLKIADFGLARNYGSPLKSYTQMVVTLWYRAPELLLGTKTYTPAIDIWSVGCIFAELLNKGVAMMQGRGEIDQLEKIFRLLGSPSEEVWPGFKGLPQAKSIHWKPGYKNQLRQKLSLTDHAFDLLNRMLSLDPSKRISAKDALAHEYFKESPRPQALEYMPTFPSLHEGLKRKKQDLEEQELKDKLLKDAEVEEQRYRGARTRHYERKKGGQKRK